MGKKKIETIICEKIYPFKLNEKGRSHLSWLEASYPYDLLKECIDIGVAQYFKYDDEDNLESNSVEIFLDKLGGIAYNKSLPVLEQELKKIKNKCKSKFSYWDENRASEILSRYVKELEHESSVIEDYDTIMPKEIFDGLQNNFQKICKQINASYKHDLFDCTAVMMRRLLEGLLVLSFQNNGIDDGIIDKKGKIYTLDKVIKNAEQNETLKLSSNTKKYMSQFKDLGNYSADKIWFNATKNDIEPNILRFRAIIEELIYKAKLR